MKRIVFLFGLLVVIVVSSCSFEAYQCPTYSQTNKITKHGAKAQVRYTKKHKL